MAWFVANFFLLYIPTDFQVHMLNGWQVPMGILATLALYDWVAPGLGRFRFPIAASRASRSLTVLSGL